MRYRPFGWTGTLFTVRCLCCPQEYAEKEVQEIKHCRLAMLAAIGALVGPFPSEIGGINFGGIPEYTSKAGYFFPDGL